MSINIIVAIAGICLIDLCYIFVILLQVSSRYVVWETLFVTGKFGPPNALCYMPCLYHGGFLLVCGLVSVTPIIIRIARYVRKY
jgi:hypothetical protein